MNQAEGTMSQKMIEPKKKCLNARPSRLNRGANRPTTRCSADFPEELNSLRPTDSYCTLREGIARTPPTGHNNPVATWWR